MKLLLSDVFHDIYFTARDGLRIYARHYPARNAAGRVRRPVLCLAGLTRNSRDFHGLASALSGDTQRSRDVFTIDYRGRGRSQFDTDWRNYALPIEMFDVLDFMTIKGLHRAAVIGTSRGGLLAMLMAAAQPTTLGTVILNDIGPVIEPEGLTRISGYVGRIPLPDTWQQAAQLVKKHNQGHFSAVKDDEWEAIARQWFNDRNGKPVAGYDSNLSRAMSVLDGPIPELWPQFEGLKRLPLLIIRGENSDILSPTTVEEMRRRHPATTSVVVAGQGHAPLLNDAPTIAAILNFLSATDKA